MDRRKFLGVGLVAFAAIVAPGTNLMAVDFRATKPAAWEAEKTAEGIKPLFVSPPQLPNKKYLKPPRLAETVG